MECWKVLNACQFCWSLGFGTSGVAKLKDMTAELCEVRRSYVSECDQIKSPFRRIVSYYLLFNNSTLTLCVKNLPSSQDKLPSAFYAIPILSKASRRVATTLIMTLA
jgi:hypothetical protein